MSTGESIGRAVFRASGRVHCGVRPAPGARFDTFDPRRLRDCFVRVRGGTAPAGDDVQGWEALLRNVELMTDAPGQPVATVDGQLPFGETPGSYARRPDIVVANAWLNLAAAHHHSDRSGTNGSSEDVPSPRARAPMKVPFQAGQTK